MSESHKAQHSDPEVSQQNSKLVDTSLPLALPTLHQSDELENVGQSDGDVAAQVLDQACILPHPVENSVQIAAHDDALHDHVVATKSEARAPALSTDAQARAKCEAKCEAEITPQMPSIKVEEALVKAQDIEHFYTAPAIAQALPQSGFKSYRVSAEDVSKAYTQVSEVENLLQSLDEEIFKLRTTENKVDKTLLDRYCELLEVRFKALRRAQQCAFQHGKQEHEQQVCLQEKLRVCVEADQQGRMPSEQQAPVYIQQQESSHDLDLTQAEASLVAALGGGFDSAP